MIRAYLLLLLIFAIGVGAMSLIAQDAGYVLVELHQWVFESSVPGALLALFILLGALWLLLRLLGLSFALPERVRDALRRRRAERATQAFETGLLHLFEGDWSRAESELVRRAADHPTPHLNYIAAARAAQRLGAPDRRDHYLDLALRNDPDVEAAVLRTRAELSLRSGDFAAARDAARRLHERRPKLPYAVELLAESYAGLSAWEPLLALLRDSEELAAPSVERRHALKIAAYTAQLNAAAGETRLDRYKQIWKAASALHDDPALRNSYIRGLIRMNAEAEAAAQITAALNQNWDGELVTLYADLETVDPVTALAAVEQWLTRYGERGELLITAGRSCLRAKLWGKAQSYLDAALRNAPSARAWLAQAQLGELTQDADAAAQARRNGLEFAANRESGLHHL